MTRVGPDLKVVSVRTELKVVAPQYFPLPGRTASSVLDMLTFIWDVVTERLNEHILVEVLDDQRR